MQKSNSANIEETDLDGYLGGVERRIRLLGRVLMSMGGDTAVIEDAGMMGELGFLLGQEADKLRFVRQGLCSRCSVRIVREQVLMESSDSTKGLTRARESRPSVYGSGISKVLLPGSPFLLSWPYLRAIEASG